LAARGAPSTLCTLCSGGVLAPRLSVAGEAQRRRDLEGRAEHATKSSGRKTKRGTIKARGTEGTLSMTARRSSSRCRRFRIMTTEKSAATKTMEKILGEPLSFALMLRSIKLCDERTLADFAGDLGI